MKKLFLLLIIFSFCSVFIYANTEAASIIDEVTITTNKEVGEKLRFRFRAGAGDDIFADINENGKKDDGEELSYSVDARYGEPVEITITRKTLKIYGNIRWFDCTEGGITAINLAKCSKLEKLNCGKNQIGILDLRNHKAIQSVTCDENKLTQLLLPKGDYLNTLICNNYCWCVNSKNISIIY